MVVAKVDGQILFGTRSEKSKILFDVRGEKRKIYLVTNDSYENYYLAVKGLKSKDSLKSQKYYRRLLQIKKMVIDWFSAFHD